MDIIPSSMPTAARFWCHADMSGGPRSCWAWRGSVNSRGYGIFVVDGMKVKAHRYSYLINYGPVSHGLFVCHKCDNPRCVNPMHLFLGTALDNSTDMIEKGRARKASKLNPDLVREIRVDTRTHSVIAREFGVSQSLITRIQRRQVWRHVA